MPHTYQFAKLPLLLLGITTVATAHPPPGAASDTTSTAPVSEAGKEAFAKQALALVQQGNVATYAKLMPSIEELSKWCPVMIATRGEEAMVARLDKLDKQTAENLPECKKLDWSTAKQTKATGGEVQEQVPGCAGVTQLRDFKFYFEIGEETYQVKLDDPFVRDGKHFGFLGDPECSLE